MNRGFSIYLDAMRFLAALVVVLSHLAYPRFTGETLNGLRAWDYGRDAVIIFFVLSGLVIAYVAHRDGSWQRYGFNRMTRLFSVMIPAVLLTLVLDRAGAALFPAAYDGWWYAPLPIGEFLGYGLSFTNEWLWGPVRLGTNGPLWSLSYEVAYYLLFGIAVYLKGPRRALLLFVTLLLAGPRVLLLLPVWLLGVWVWRTIAADAQGVTRLAAFLMAALLPVFYTGAVGLGLNVLLADTGSRVLSGALLQFTQGFSSSYLWHIVLGAFFGLHLLGMATLLKNWQVPDAVARGVRWLAGASFTVYVLHYPLMQFTHAALPPGLKDSPAALLALVLIGCFCVAEITERRLTAFRHLFGRKEPET